MAKKSFAKTIGKGLARVQSFVDDTLDYTFKSMKSASKPKRADKKDKGWKGKTLRGLKKCGSFLGETGESFYDEYEKIKAKRNERR
jgi:hypothetical protein